MKTCHSIKQMVSDMTDNELQEMLRREYLRRLTRYKLADELLRKKYDMTFEEFEQENLVAKKGFSWEVESDAQEWEMSIDGIKTCLRKLEEVKVGY